MENCQMVVEVAKAIELERVLLTLLLSAGLTDAQVRRGSRQIVVKDSQKLGARILRQWRIVK